MLRLRVVGRPAVEAGDGAVWPPGRRAGEVLAWLAVHPGMHARGDLAPRFWPDVLDESARASLRTALHELRRGLPPAARPHLLATREAVGLDDGVWVDLREVRRALREGRDEDAVALGDGEVLQGIEGEWVHAVRGEHRAALSDALGRLAGAAAARGDREGALRWARRRAALDPLAEGPVRALMQLHAADGDRAAALAAYEGLRDRMARELRMAPSPATREVADRLRAGAPAAPAPAPARPARRLGDRVADAARRSFVGRERERAELAGLLAAPDAGVVFLTGPGGIGKSRLLHAALDAAPAGVRAVVIECGEVEPTPAGFLAALAARVGGAPDPEAVADALGAGAPRPVLALDAYERFGLLDAWLRREFLPLLPDHVLTVVAGREPPAAAWRTAAGWGGLVREVPLAGLDEAAAMRLLTGRGLAPGQAARVNAFARGHPLALELAAGAVARRPGLELAGGPPQEVVGELVRAFLDGLDAGLVDTVRAAAAVRRVDERLLRALLGRERVHDEYARLRALPFCEPAAEGVLLHDVVRDAVARDLAQGDPERAAAYRRRAAAALAESARDAAGPRLWPLTADLLYLVGNPVVREAFFPSGWTGHRVEPAGPDDAAAVRDMTRAWDPASAPWVARWWERHPQAFSVSRGPAGEVSGYSILLEGRLADPALCAGDPVAAAFAAHMAACPLDDGETVLFVRHAMAREEGLGVGPATGALFLDAKRSYMALRPALRRTYTMAPVGGTITPMLAALGFRPAGAPVATGGAAYEALVLDFGPGSVDGWLAGLIDAELGAGAPPPPPAPAAAHVP